MTPREIVNEYGPGEVADTLLLKAITDYGDQRAAEERERCAKMAEELERRYKESDWRDCINCGSHAGRIAARIRGGVTPAPVAKSSAPSSDTTARPGT